MACSSGDQAENRQEKSFAETNLRMLEEELLCDVTFLVGKKQEPVKAHRFMLASRSHVFYAMFCGPLAENQEAIPVPDIDVDTFKLVIRFLYTADCTLTGDSVMATLYAARKYEVEALVKKCSEFLQDHIDDENVCTVLQQAITFDAADLTKQCLSYIFGNGQNVLQSRSFLSINNEALQKILEADDLGLDELAIYRACVQWAQHQCSEAGEETSDTNLRKRLGDLVYLIRFPVMSLKEFTVHVSESSILSDKEKVCIFKSFAIKKETHDKFIGRPRFTKVDARFERFEHIDQQWWHQNTSAISFTCSRNISLKGVCLFRPSQSGYITGKLSIANDETTLCAKDFEITYQHGQKVEEIMLEHLLELEKGKVYYLEQTCDGSPTYYGVQGKADIIIEGVKVTFSATQRNLCGSNDEYSGQFYSLHLIDP